MKANLEHSVGSANAAATQSVLLDEAYREFCRRRETGDPVDPDEYCAQFPAMRSALVRLFHAHLFLEENLGLCAEHPEVVFPEAGDTFLDFKLLLELGKGAFARVFLATEPRLGDRLVAVKIAYQGGAEAEVLGRIQHPNIVPIHSIQEDAATGLTAVCMPYVGSATLCDVRDKAFPAPAAQTGAILAAVRNLPCPLDPSAMPATPAPVLQDGSYQDGVRWIGACLADALAFIHRHGICHRDLKPSNVLLSPEGVPMLLDFNLCAEAAEPVPPLGGTVPYMAPEQLRGMELDEASPFDARSDIFSLGVILYELMTGAHPFGPVNLKLGTSDLRQHLLERQRRGSIEARTVNRDVDAAVSRLIQRCLAFDPEKRPQTGAEIAAALRQGPTAATQTRRWLGRHWRKVVAAAVFLAAVSLGGWTFAALRPPYSERQVETGRHLCRQGRYDEAVQRFNEALQADPNNNAARFARARAHQQLGQYNEAMQDYRELNQRCPDGRNRAACAYCLNRIQDDKTAIGWYLLAIESEYAIAEVYNNLGFTYLKLNQRTEARKNLDKAIELDPGMSAAYHNRALLAYRNVKNPRQFVPAAKDNEIYRSVLSGIKDAQKALELGADTAELHYHAAQLCAVAAQVEPDRWTTETLHLLKVALRKGHDTRELNGPAFKSLAANAAFKKLADAPQVQQLRPSTLRITDPIKETW